MAIPLEGERKAALPVVKRTALGEKFFGAVVMVQQRDRLKKDDATGQMVPVTKTTGKARQELVVTCITLPGTTASVGLGEDEHVPETAELVRLILKGKAFGDWIENKKALGRTVQVGDIVKQVTDRAQVYDAQGNPSGAEITDQAALNAVPRGRSVGVYGPVTLNAPKEDSEWVMKAEAAYHRLQEPIAAEPSGFGGDDFPPEPPPDDDGPPF
jgi:hypothetical protein